MDVRPDDLEPDGEPEPVVIDLRDERSTDSFEQKLAEIDAMLDALGIPG